MKAQPKLSVVCITYNQERYIRQALEGFVAQKVSFPIEVIVSDDCSTDSTPLIIQEYADKYPSIFRPILRKSNLGAIENSIKALSAAKGEYIALCEGDDYWTDPNKLQYQVDYLDKHPKYGGCFHVVDVKFADTDEADYRYPDVEDASWYTTEELLKVNFVPTNSVVYRRRDYSKLPNNVMPFDWYLHLYHSQAGPLAYIPKVMSVYRKHQDGIWWDFDKNREQIWKRYGLAYLALYEETLRLFPGKDKYLNIIEESINTLLGTLIDIDNKFDTHLLYKALELYPNRAGAFMRFEHARLKKMMSKTDQLTTELLKVGDERTELVAKIDELNAAYIAASKRLDTITNTLAWRVVSKIGTMTRNVRRPKNS